MSESNVLFSGDLTVTIGGVDVTTALLPGLSYSSTNPGGFGEAPMRLKVDALLGMFNVMAFGATGDGETDDLAAIEAAITAADGDSVYFPAGDYYLSDVLEVPSGTVLVGDAGLGPDACAAWLMGQIEYDSSSSFTDLKIGPEEAGVSSARNVDGADGVTFTRCHFRGGGGTSAAQYACMSIGDGADAANLTFTDCEWERSLGTSFNGTGYAENTLSINAGSNTLETLDFIDCHFGVTNGTATGAQRIMVEAWTGHGSGNHIHDVTFSGCTFEASNWHQLDAACYGDSGRFDGLTVEDCIFKGGGVNDFGTAFGFGIVLEWPANVSITDNTFYRCKEYAISTYNPGDDWPWSTEYTITGNTFDWDTAYEGISAHYGIMAIRGQDNVVTGNTFECHTTVSPNCVNCVGANSKYNTVTGNTFNLNGAQDTVEENSGAADNTITPNTVNRT